MKSAWHYSVEWREEVESGRRVYYAERFDFDNEPDAIAAHSFAVRFSWVKPTQFDAHVSALFQRNSDEETGRQMLHRIVRQSSTKEAV